MKSLSPHPPFFLLKPSLHISHQNLSFSVSPSFSVSLSRDHVLWRLVLGGSCQDILAVTERLLLNNAMDQSPIWHSDLSFEEKKEKKRKKEEVITRRCLHFYFLSITHIKGHFGGECDVPFCIWYHMVFSHHHWSLLWWICCTSRHNQMLLPWQKVCNS